MNSMVCDFTTDRYASSLSGDFTKASSAWQYSLKYDIINASIDQSGYSKSWFLKAEDILREKILLSSYKQ